MSGVQLASGQKFYLLRDGNIVLNKYIKVSHLPQGNQKGRMEICCDEWISELYFVIRNGQFVFDSINHQIVRSVVNGVPFLNVTMGDNTIVFMLCYDDVIENVLDDYELDPVHESYQLELETVVF